MSGWVRYENTMPDNLKLVGLSDRAFRLWIHAACYCSRARSSGRIPETVITGLSQSATSRTVEELLHAGLLEPADAGYAVHDFLDFNPSKEKDDERRRRTRERVAGWREKHRSPPPVDAVSSRSIPSPDEAVSTATTPCVTPLQGGPVTLLQGGPVTLLQTRYSRARADSELNNLRVKTEIDVPGRRVLRPGRAASKRANQNENPASLSPNLHRTSAEVLAILAAVHDDRGGQAPTLRGVGLALSRFPDRDHIAVARELEHWATVGRGQARPIQDWCRTLATFLQRSPAGTPPVIRPDPAAHIPARRESPSDLLRAINGHGAAR